MQGPLSLESDALWCSRSAAVRECFVQNAASVRLPHGGETASHRYSVSAQVNTKANAKANSNTTTQPSWSSVARWCPSINDGQSLSRGRGGSSLTLVHGKQSLTYLLAALREIDDVPGYVAVVKQTTKTNLLCMVCGTSSACSVLLRPWFCSSWFVIRNMTCHKAHTHSTAHTAQHTQHSTHTHSTLFACLWLVVAYLDLLLG